MVFDFLVYWKTTEMGLHVMLESQPSTRILEGDIIPRLYIEVPVRARRNC